MRTDILEQAMQIRKSMDAAASVLTDNQATKAPRIYPCGRLVLQYQREIDITIL